MNPEWLAIMRQNWLAQARDQVLIYVPVWEDDGYGGRRRTGDWDVTTVPCTHGPIGGASSPVERMVLEREIGSALTVFYLPHDAIVDEDSRLELNGTEGFDVVSVVPPRTHQVKRRVVARSTGPLPEEES